MSAASIVYALDELPNEDHVVTIGSFDGVHRGHQHLLRQVVKAAEARDAASLAITFDPLPAEILRPDKAPPRLCDARTRTELMIASGIERVALLEFDDALAHQSADEFLTALHDHARTVHIVVGEDFAFGHKRQGTPEFLAERAEAYGYSLDIVKRVNPDEGGDWSSSAVRRALSDHGDVQTASQILGRYFRVNGTVTNGDHRGRTLGYPTANLSLSERQIVPADGIYAALTTIDTNGNRVPHLSLVYVGTRPTFGNSGRVVESFLLDFEGDLYDSQVSIDFVDRIRGDRAFDSVSDLVEQMKIDEVDGRRLFTELGMSPASMGRNAI